MSRYRVTPWRTPSDLLEVRHQLYLTNPGDPDRRRHAVDRVMAWKQRGNLPHAVESTALLVDAILHHNLAINSTFSVRAVYSAAFTRFVTGFCDIGRHRERSLEPSSMLDIAKQIDMPPSFVALRHEATHEDLPGVQRLMGATREALDWLWRVYWSRLEDPRDQTDAVVFEEEARRILRGFRSSRLQALRSGDKTGQEIGEAVKACLELITRSLAAAEALAKVLVGDRLIFPAERELGASLGGAFLIWDRLLQGVVEKSTHFLQSVIDNMIVALNAPGTSAVAADVVKDAFCMWLVHLCQAGGPNKFVGMSKLDVKEYTMKLCCANPSHWTNRAGEELLRIGPDGFRETWQSIFDASKLRGEEAKDQEASSGRLDSAREIDPLTGAGRSGTAGSDAVEIEVHGDSEPSDGYRGWIRVSLPPTVPIGVV